MNHTHDFFELCYVHSGTFQQIIDGQPVAQTPDTLILLRPGAWHSVWTISERDVVFNILLRRSTVHQSLRQFVSPKNPLYRFLFRSGSEPDDALNYTLFTGTTPQRTILHSMIATYFDHPPGHAELVMARLATLFAELAQTTYTPDRDTDDYLPDDLLEFIAHNYRDVTMDALSHQFSYSPRHLSRMLRAHTGKSLRQLVNGHRIDAVLNSLPTAGTSLTELVLNHGFCHINYFYEVFKRERGVSFAEHRQNNPA